ncbi:MAG: hypothetical protein GDA49_03825 [Rhodospirillales bacterium]|nr:hypothetical protein [Rhodospirillales bacterium]
MLQPVIQAAPDYLNPRIRPGLLLHDVPVVEATPESLRKFGELVTDPHGHDVEIVRWPATGRSRQRRRGEGIFPTVERGSFFNKQGRVHARVSVDFAREFGLLLKVPL